MAAVVTDFAVLFAFSTLVSFRCRLVYRKRGIFCNGGAGHFAALVKNSFDPLP